MSQDYSRLNKRARMSERRVNEVRQIVTVICLGLLVLACMLLPV